MCTHQGIEYHDHEACMYAFRRGFALSRLIFTEGVWLTERMVSHSTFTKKGHSLLFSGDSWWRVNVLGMSILMLQKYKTLTLALDWVDTHIGETT